MNSIAKETLPMLKMYQALRNQLIDILENEDLSFNPGGDNLTFGQLCVEMGVTQQTYIQAFETWVHTDSPQDAEICMATDVAGLKSWYEKLDAALDVAVTNLSDDDIQQKMIDRGGDFKLPAKIHLLIYQEALLIFYGKAMVYLKGLGKERPKQWTEWIA